MTTALGEAQTKQQDGLAVSIATYLLALTSLAVTYLFIAASEYDRNYAISHLAGLEHLLAGREIANTQSRNHDSLTKRDLPTFFSSASRVAGAPTPGGGDPHYTDTLDSRGFTEDVIVRTKVMPFSSRLRQARCKASAIQLAPGERIDFATFQIVSKTYVIPSENISLVVFESCLSIDRDSSAIFIFRSGSDLVFGLPAVVEKNFPPLAAPYPLKSFEYRDIDRLLNLLPKEVQKFVKLPHPMILLHASAIEHYILANATARHGRFYAPDDLNVAIERLFDEQSRSATLFGISASLSNLMLLGPLLYLVISFELWRRVRWLSSSKKAISVFWFGSDTRDSLGAWTARVYSFVPIAGFATLYGAFAYVNGGGLISFEQLERMLHLFRSGASLRNILTYYPINMGSSFLLLLVPAQALIVLLTTRQLLRVVLQKTDQERLLLRRERWDQARNLKQKPVRR